MIERLNPVEISEENKERMEIALWAWNSHWWVETNTGYYQCKWCKRHNASEMGINMDFPLCKKNPAIKLFLDKIVKCIREGEIK